MSFVHPFPHCGANPTRIRPPGCDAPLFLIFLNVLQTRGEGHVLVTHSSRRRCVREREATPNPLRRARNILVSDLSDLPLPLNSSESHFCNPAQPSPAQRRSAPAAKLVFAT
ncbi:hypothetical protein D4764_21G0003630 [Takifugu flavidus]|uniref:Uncharacterized protein n=1 Tax=Takifugu flavidus TaxID=433684 RepID=A0A5C6NE42_9TELE|nr:hypothetical protein D4764_21G0003630 [Takifugu flavidus]